MIVYVASCGDKTHKHDASIVNQMRKIPSIIDSFESYVRIGNKKFCIAAMALEDDEASRRAKKIMKWMFPSLKEIRRMNDSPFYPA